MLVILGLALGGCFLLVSAPRGTEAGHVAWRSGSVLRVITELMALSFEYPTRTGTEVKWLAQNLGAAAALLAVVIGWFLRTRPEEESLRPRIGALSAGESVRTMRDYLGELTPTSAAQAALLLFAAWTILSAWWAHWPQAAVAEGLRQLMIVVWALVLGRALGPRAVRWAGLILVALLAVTAALGIWYYLERNPEQRLKFPIGNPIFLAACLLPALTISLVMLGGLLRALAGRWFHSRAKPAPGTGWPARAGWLAAGSAATLLIAGTAFALTGSRGPVVGLAVGLAAAAYAAASKRLRWVVLAVTLAALLGGTLLIQSRVGSMEGPRWATVRLRIYAWSYAMDRFRIRPVSGAGQGSYLLGAHAMAIDAKDPMQDPAAFPGELLGHAHNEWLEVLADLGATGFGLISTALGLTFWSAGLALRRLTAPLDRWLLLGLSGALAAMIVEELTDVALRMPGLPLVFYTVIGLMWAMSRAQESTRAQERRHGRTVRGVGLIAGLIAAGVMARLAIMDWNGALAEHRITPLTEAFRWDDALATAETAQTNRLVLEDHLAAMSRATRVARDAAEYRLGQFSETVRRAIEAKKTSPQIAQIARDDAQSFDRYASSTMETGQELLHRMPYYPWVAGWIADVVLMRGQMEHLQQQLGLRAQAFNPVAEARQWLLLEYEREPFNAVTALRLLQLWGDQPLPWRLDKLRIPLRRNPLLAEARAALAALKEEPEFGPILTQWFATAAQAVGQPPSAWEDPYAPETLRLAAVASELQGDYADAAGLAQEAADLLLTLRSHFPRASSYARMEAARYTLLAHPRQPELALAMYRRALADWPASGAGPEGARFRRNLAFYLLAAGSEEEARQHLLTQAVLTDEVLDAQIAEYLAELVQAMLRRGADDRPEGLEQWLRRGLQLAPEHAGLHMMTAQVALEKGEERELLSQLEWLEQHGNRDLMMHTLSFLAQRFPESTVLRTFIETRVGVALTQPDQEHEEADHPRDTSTAPSE